MNPFDEMHGYGLPMADQKTLRKRFLALAKRLEKKKPKVKKRKARR